MNKHYIIGIDEAGRGPWAWPVVAGGFLIEAPLSDSLGEIFPGVTDSKKLSEEKREKLYHMIEKMQDESRCQYSFAYRDALDIDSLGIREANRQCMQDVMLSLLQFTDDTDTIRIMIDGCDNYRFESLDVDYWFAQRSKKKGKIRQDLSSTTETGLARNDGDEIGKCISQKITISYHIQGDLLFREISLASIVAKVVRDRMMCEYSEDFPEYGFSLHKGYGTRKHQDALLNYGITPLHRKSYAPVKALISSDS